ncbi:heparan-alpha-glucosaminide N-acetyltransferase domain-containing protein [uncultured Tenacibaculum sp.]|uniref:DUF418 domain-containing protein n=1 Tax=uncultured Tenacibaculum sp. TaxID=174713 RepID=UPI00260537B2|nr:heparan-alpha-glucosaminide N-acetyltransferase domain-containing protein [uncultured Tenacibaculum sp.]
MNRIIGIDVARAFAIIGMIIVNFKVAFGNNGNEALKYFTGLFEGKAAATFVVLAGIGLAFMSNSSIIKGDKLKLKNVKKKILKRAILLFVIGLLYLPIWIADILHFYGIYMLITVLFLTTSKRKILFAAGAIILLYPILMLFFDYDIGWDFKTFEYHNFWTVPGFVRNLFYNGFHPVIPWTAFMLIGLWFGKQNLTDETFVRKSIKISMSIFVITWLVSKMLLYIFSEGNTEIKEELNLVLGMSPMPPLPIYMISGSSFAIGIISICILISYKFKNHFIIQVLKKTGQLALSFYVAHVVIGIGIIAVFAPEKMGKYSITFSFIYALLFSISCIVFAYVWSKSKKQGPLEWLIRKITN